MDLLTIDTTEHFLLQEAKTADLIDTVTSPGELILLWDISLFDNPWCAALYPLMWIASIIHLILAGYKENIRVNDRLLFLHNMLRS